MESWPRGAQGFTITSWHGSSDINLTKAAFVLYNAALHPCATRTPLPN
jgi:hypothetical protein